MTQLIDKHITNRKYLRKQKLYSPEFLIKIRKRNKLTRKQVIEKTGISYHTLDKLENGKIYSPELNTLLLLAETYYCCISEFLLRPRHDYIHCTKIEYDLIQAIRKYPDFDLTNLIKLLDDKSKKSTLVRKLIRDILQLPDDIIEDYIKLNEHIIKKLREDENNEKNNHFNTNITIDQLSIPIL